MELLQNLLLAFSVASEPVNLLYCVVGVLFGIVIGSLPGLGPSAGIAILLPLTYGMTPVAGIIMLAKNWIDINRLLAVANANRSAGYFDPMRQVLIMAGLSTLGAFLLGLGLAMPKQTAGRIREQALIAADRKREAEIASRVAEAKHTEPQ